MKNLSVSALLTKMAALSDDEKTTGQIKGLLGMAEKYGLGGQPAAKVIDQLTGGTLGTN